MISASLHGEGKAGKLIASMVNIQAIDIVLKNESRDFTSLVALLLIHLAEQVEGIDKNVSTTHTRVNETNILCRMNIFRNNIYLTFRSWDVIRHLINQTAFRMQCHPNTTE